MQQPPGSIVRSAIDLLTGNALVALVTYFDFSILRVNAATAAFSYLLVVLLLATRTGLQASVTASLAGVLCYNFFFLPPIGTLTIADPQNWVALFAFLITAITVSHLSASARNQAREAGAGRREMEKLYEFSRALIIGNSESTLAGQIAQQIARVFAVPSVIFYDLSEDVGYHAGPGAPPMANRSASEMTTILRTVARGSEPWHKPEVPARVIPVGLGGRTIGSLGVSGVQLSQTVLTAIAQLAAIALERARVQDAINRTGSARENERLKSTLLDALAHEFKTPLTSIKAAVSTLLSQRDHDALESELLTIVEEETDRLTELVTESIKIARIGTGQVHLHRKKRSVAALVESALSKMRNASDGRQIAVDIAPNVPDLFVDPELCELALRQLIGNALKYSPPSAAICISAEPLTNSVVIHVADTGPGIPEAEQASVFDKFYRGEAHRHRISGTGMGLTIAREIVQAHDGEIWLESKSGGGTRFSFILPQIVPRED